MEQYEECGRSDYQAGERIVWVDANGTVVGEYMPVLSNRTNGFEIDGRRLYQGPHVPPLALLGYGLDGLHVNNDCTGEAYMVASYGWEMTWATRL